jgi:hypothetical protein
MRISTKSIMLISVAFAALSACATTSEAPKTHEANSPAPSSTQRAIKQAQAGVGEAAMSPLQDVNLKRDKIPERLKAIKNPYDVNAAISCETIATEVVALDELLGRDWDVPPPDKAALKDRAADGASTAFLDTIASEASGLIPYRGLVRTVSGANRHAKKVLKAYERGSHRRSFLKGLGLVKGCAYPAAPQDLPEPDDPKVVFK